MSDAQATFCNSFFLRGVSLVALAVMLPAMLALGYSVHSSLQASEASSKAQVTLEADTAAQVVEELLSRGELLLTLLSTRPEAQSMQAKDCGRLFTGLDALSPVFINLLLSDIEGRRVCSLLTAVGGQAPVTESADWFEEAARAGGFALSGPRQGQTSNRKIVVMSAPVRGPGNQKVGVVALSIDLVALSRLFEHDGAMPNRSITLLNQSGQILSRLPDAETYIGQRIRADALARRLQHPKEVLTSIGADGVERAYGSAEVHKYNLRVTVGVPVEDIVAAARREMMRGVLSSLVMLAVGSVVAWLMARRLAAPLQQLVMAASRVAEGDPTARVQNVLPGEMGVLARRFNEMLDSRSEYLAEAQENANKARWQSKVHQTLSATNRAILRAQAQQALFTEVCGICVNFGHAVMAYVAEVQGTHAVPVAYAGRAREYTQGLTFDLDPAATDAISATASAIREGQVVIINDVVNDPRTAPYRDRTSQFNVRSVAAVPLRCQGRVVGALCLQVDVADFFDTTLTGMLQEMAADVSVALDNLQREASRLGAEAASRRHEQQLAGIIETAMDAILTVDADYKIVVFNSAASRIFGLPASEALGQSINQFIPERFQRRHDQHIRNFAQTGSTARSMGPSLSLMARRANGAEFPIEASISRLGHGRDALMTVVLRDVTKLKATEQLRQSQVEAEAAGKAKSDFLSRMSHEMRTPLNAVLGFTRLLSASAQSRLNEQERQQLQNVMGAAEQLRGLIDDVLDVARMESGVSAVELRPTELCGLLDTVVSLSATAAEERGVSVSADYAQVRPVHLLADAVRLKQVLTNILSNAIKYNRPQGQVLLDVRRSNGRITVVCHDTGIGMTEGQVAALLQPMSRLGREDSDAVDSGINLPLCRELVELMGGSLDIVSTVDKGSTITVSLPDLGIVAPATSSGGADASVSPIAQALKSLRGTVVYIEDNPMNAVLVEQMLSFSPSIRVVIAPDGRTGIINATDERPDLVLLDMQLPDLEGLQVLRILKEDPVTRHLRVVALSASAFASEVSAALEAGAEEYWTKPLDIEQFTAGMKKYLHPAVDAGS